MQSTIDMMAMRRAALDAMAGLPEPPGSLSAEAIRIDAGPQPDPGVLAVAVRDRLLRDAGPGAALVTGLDAAFDVLRARKFHEALFAAVWELVEPAAGDEVPGNGYKVKMNVIADGAIPLELYGSAWSFKELHMDRDALIFSHLYGPTAGFDGGALLLADVRAYMGRHSAGFTDLFDWSQEPTPGSKPVLRAEHESAVLAEYGANVGPLGPGEILFVNNLPSAGILHGATPVEVTDPDGYVREYHRCSVRRVNR